MTPDEPGRPSPDDVARTASGAPLPDVRVVAGRLARSGGHPDDQPPPPWSATGRYGPATGAGPARPRRAGPLVGWWRRLGGCLVLASLAALMAGPSGDADRPLAGARGSLSGERGAVFLGAAVLAWLGLTWWPRLRAPLGRGARLVAAHVRESAAGLRDRRGLRGRRAAGAGGSVDGGPPGGAGEPLRVPGHPPAPEPTQVVPPWHRTWAARPAWAVMSRHVPAQPAPGGPLPAAPLPAGPRWDRGRGGRAAGYAGYAGALALAAAAPLVMSTAAQQSMVNDIGLYALLALGLNVVVGYAGLLDLGYIAFFAIGAYTAAYLCSATAMPWHAPFQLNPFFAMPAAVVVAALAGLALGAPTLRLRGDYLAIVTLGFGEIVQLLANNADGITGGARGVFGVPPLSVEAGGLHYAWGLDPLPYYYLLLALVVLVMAVLGVWERSRTGRAWAAIRQDEVAAEATGVRTTRMKLLAFAIGASVSGFAGVVLATKQFFNPQTFSLQASLLVLTVVIFGGMGSRLGVVLGAVVLQGLAFFLRDRVPAGDRFSYFGAIVVIMMVFRPQGLLPPRPRPRAVRPDLLPAGSGPRGRLAKPSGRPGVAGRVQAISLADPAARGGGQSRSGPGGSAT